MQANTACLWILLFAVAGCAKPAPPPAPAAKTVVTTPAEVGTVLAVHRVPIEDSPAARILSGQTAGAATDDVEYIVRAPDGATIAVVQSAIDGLHPGDRVSIVRGASSATAPRLQAAGG